MWGVSLRHPMLALFLSGEFLLHIPCWLHFYLGSFSYTPRAGFIIMRGVSLTHPVLALFLSGEFLKHIPCSLFFLFFFCGEFLLDIPCWLYFYLGSFSYTFRAGFIFIWGVSLTHPVLGSFLSGEFLLHIPCWLHFSVGNFSYTSHAGFFFFLSGEFLLHIPCFFFLLLLFLWEVSLTHPMLDFVSSLSVLLLFYFLFFFNVESFS